jgi:transcriptional regulator with XRE-family HTH domain
MATWNGDPNVKLVMQGLVARRRELGLRQADIAERVGVGQQQVSHWERGQFLPLHALFAYAEAVGLRVVLGLVDEAE